MFFCTGVGREKKEGIKRTIKNTCWNFSVTQGLTVMFTSSKELEQRKKPHVFVARTPFAHCKKNTWTKKLNRKFKRQGVVFYTKSIKWYCPFDKFWSLMFKCLMGVFLHANNMYHTSLKCPLILVSKYLFNPDFSIQPQWL